MLSKNLYSKINFQDINYSKLKKEEKNILLNILNYSDGNLNLLDISNLRKLNFLKSVEILKICLEKLLKFV